MKKNIYDIDSWVTDINWLNSYGISKKEAFEFIKNIVNSRQTIKFK